MHINNDIQRNSNISEIFKTIWESNGISRIDISKTLGIHRSSVTNIIDNLKYNEIVFEGSRGNVTEKGGRKPINILINPDAGYVIGIELQEDFYSAVIVNLAGRVVYKKKGKFDLNYKELNYYIGKSKKSVNEEKITDRKINYDNNEISKDKNNLENIANFEKKLNQILETVYCEAELNLKKYLCICVGIPGIVDTKNGIIKKSTSFGLNDFDFTKTIYKKERIPILIENDAKCCAWLQKGQKKSQINNDFMCVLLRNHQEKGVGVGLSIVINDKIIDGYNFAAGEYRSISWRKGKKGQTGLPEAVIKTINKVSDSYREWIKDLFSTLTIYIPVLQPKKIFLYGIDKEKVDFINQIIKEDISQFEEILTDFDSNFEIIKEDGYEISTGAALMFIQKLFGIPYEKNCYYEQDLNWDLLIKKIRESYYGKCDN